MTVTDLMTRTCTITRRSESGTFDDFGNDIPEETTESVLCELQQVARQEPGDLGEISDTRWTLFLPEGTDIRTGDAVTVSGVTYELIGDPWDARNPRTTLESHIECTLRKTGGAEDAS